MSESPSIELTVLGGGGEVGASCFQLSYNGRQIILDSGTHPKKDGRSALPEFGLLRRAPDVAILSHAHVDHCGSLPYLVRQFPGLKTHATKPTVRIIDRMLHNSVSVMKIIAKERGVTDYPLYEHEDVDYALKATEGHNFNTPFNLPLDIPATCEFIHAGHVLGSSSVLLKFPDHTVYYSGDISEKDQELLGGYDDLPEGTVVDTLIVESTHGATEESMVYDFDDEIERLAQSIDSVLRGGGTVMVPTFALGRTQEILNILARLQEEGRIPEVPIYASGLGRAVYEIYDRHYDCLLPDADLRPLKWFERIGNIWNPKVVRALLSEPGIIVATSGMMLENTPSALIAEEMVKHKQHGIFFVGYLDHETLGYKLLHAEKDAALQFALSHDPVEVALENIKRFHFSAHASRAALKEFIKRINPKNVIYVHGDPDAIEWMAKNASNGARKFTPGIGQTVTLET